MIEAAQEFFGLNTTRNTNRRVSVVLWDSINIHLLLEAQVKQLMSYTIPIRNHMNLYGSYGRPVHSPVLLDIDYKEN